MEVRFMPGDLAKYITHYCQICDSFEGRLRCAPQERSSGIIDLENYDDEDHYYEVEEY